MRIEITTNGKVTDPDIRALYTLVYALDNSTPRMKEANLRFVADRMGFDLVRRASRATRKEAPRPEKEEGR